MRYCFIGNDQGTAQAAIGKRGAPHLQRKPISNIYGLPL
jgi:hypothetical protein